MSDSFNFIECQFTDEQLNTALKMIITAFENQNRSSQTEIHRLEDKLSKSNLKLLEMEQKYAALVQNRSQYEAKMASMINKNNQLNQRLLESIKENNTLKNIKKSIISTIEQTEIVDQSDQLSPFENSQNTNNIITINNSKHHKPQLYFEENKKSSAFGNRNTNRNKSKEYLTDFPIKSTMHASSNTINLLQQPRLSRNLSNFTPSSAAAGGNGRICTSPKVNSFNMSSDFIDSIFNSNCNSNSNSNSNGNSNDNGYKSNNKNFFKNCRKTINQEEYKEMIEIVRGFNMKKITKQNTFNKISYILQLKYPDLYEEFKKMFRPHD